MIFSFFFSPSFQKSIGDLLVQMATIYKASTHRSTILIDRNLMPTLMSTFTRLLDIQLDLFISYKSQNVFENKSYYFIVYQPNLIFQYLPTLLIRIAFSTDTTQFDKKYETVSNYPKLNLYYSSLGNFHWSLANGKNTCSRVVLLTQ